MRNIRQKLRMGVYALAATSIVMGLSANAAPQGQDTARDTQTAAAAAPAVHAASEHAEWGYAGPGGPDHWSELSSAYSVCNTGQQESPIDLKGVIPADLGTLGIKWSPMPIHATNNGHTVQYDAPAGNSFSMMGSSYALAQFHIHHPSEHLLNGERFPLEIHFVHKMPDGRIGVIGVLVSEGAANPTLQKLLDAIPASAGKTTDGAPFDPRALLPKNHGFDRYEGSLTTPPCTESVDWVVLRTPITASAAQVQQFAKLFPFNARPLQPLDRRFLLGSH
jgi:carbonic anhydrase